MINRHQRELRRTAARAFVESLDQLQESLQPEGQLSTEPDISSTSSKQEQFRFDLKTFEQAVADIEEYIEKQQNKE